MISSPIHILLLFSTIPISNFLIKYILYTSDSQYPSKDTLAEWLRRQTRILISVSFVSAGSNPAGVETVPFFVNLQSFFSLYNIEIYELCFFFPFFFFSPALRV